MNGRDVGVVERCQEPRFTIEPQGAVRIRRQIGADHLEGNVAFEPGIMSPVNCAHATFAEQVSDDVDADAAACRDAHSSAGIILGRFPFADLEVGQ